MVPIRDQRGAVEAAAGMRANDRGDEISAEADQPRNSEGEQMVRGTWIDEPVDGFKPSNTRAHEDRQDDGETGVVLRSMRSQGERDADRYGCQSVPEVMDQVGQQRDAVG